MADETVDEYEFKDRSTGLIVWGSLIVLAGFGLILYTLAGSGFRLLELSTGGGSPDLMLNEMKKEQLRLYYSSKIFTEIFYGIPAIILGVGSILRRTAARQSLEALSLIGAVCGLTYCLEEFFFACFSNGGLPTGPGLQGVLIFALIWLSQFLSFVAVPLYVRRFYADSHTVVTCRFHDPGVQPLCHLPAHP